MDFLNIFFEHLFACFIHSVRKKKLNYGTNDTSCNSFVQASLCVYDIRDGSQLNSENQPAFRKSLQTQANSCVWTHLDDTVCVGKRYSVLAAWRCICPGNENNKDCGNTQLDLKFDLHYGAVTFKRTC